MSEAESVVRDYVAAYVANNRAATLVDRQLTDIGVGLLPLIDHITVRTTDVDVRAVEFLALGFEYDAQIGVLEFDDWWARVYRKAGLPAVFIDQAYGGERGQTSVIPRWVATFGDRILHHVALRVDDIERGMAALRAQGIEFGGDIVGERGSSLRQIFTRPDLRDGEAFTVLELAERHNGYAGFLPPQADGLMQSTR
jgi:catechol 2,3-dioxygenase-like lactoylglutathione lyase family enzyme